jgi:hypothetical protein
MSIPKAVFTLASAAILLCEASAVDAGGAPAKLKPNEARLKGMKAAIADLEQGILKQKYPPLPDSPQHIDYVNVLKKDYGVAAEVVDEKDKAQRDERDGYNDVMRVEIEHRFGRGILEKLWKEAEPKEKVKKTPNGK